LKVVCLSDTHELHRNVAVPDGDLLIHAGDITFFSQRPSVLVDFNDWLAELPHKHKVVIPGNHDTLLEEEENRRMITNAHVLINSGVTLGVFKIWGSPTMPLASGAFATPHATDRAEIWSRIPSDTDFLVTHIPPAGILDRARGTSHGAGCQALRESYRRIHPRLHVFGHVHSAAGIHHTARTLFVNASLAGEFGNLDREPVVLRPRP